MNRPLEVTPELLLSRAEQEALIEQWTSYAYSISRKFYRSARRWLTFDECRAIAVEGLWEAARRFQPSKGYSFGTYSTYWVYQCLQRAKRKAMGNPAHHRYGSEEFAASIRVTCPKVSLDTHYRTQGISGDPFSFAETIPARPEPGRLEAPADFWDRAYKWLDPVKRQVIRLRYHDDLTLEEVGSVLGLTRERIRQHEAAALNQLRTRADFGDCVDDLALTRKL